MPKKNVPVTIHFSKGTYALVTGAAKRLGLPTEAFIENMIQDYIRASTELMDGIEIEDEGETIQ